MPERGTCRSCGAAVLWVRTTRGNLMPLDAAPCAEGNVVLVGDVAHVLSGDLFEQAAPEGERYKSHFATCPNAAKHRKRR